MDLSAALSKRRFDVDSQGVTWESAPTLARADASVKLETDLRPIAETSVPEASPTRQGSKNLSAVLLKHRSAADSGATWESAPAPSQADASVFQAKRDSRLRGDTLSWESAPALSKADVVFSSARSPNKKRVSSSAGQGLGSLQPAVQDSAVPNPCQAFDLADSDCDSTVDLHAQGGQDSEDVWWNESPTSRKESFDDPLRALADDAGNIEEAPCLVVDPLDAQEVGLHESPHVDVDVRQAPECTDLHVAADGSVAEMSSSAEASAEILELRLGSRAMGEPGASLASPTKGSCHVCEDTPAETASTPSSPADASQHRRVENSRGDTDTQQMQDCEEFSLAATDDKRQRLESCDAQDIWWGVSPHGAKGMTEFEPKQGSPTRASQVLESKAQKEAEETKSRRERASQELAEFHKQWHQRAAQRRQSSLEAQSVLAAAPEAPSKGWTHVCTLVDFSAQPMQGGLGNSRERMRQVLESLRATESRLS